MRLCGCAASTLSQRLRSHLPYIRRHRPLGRRHQRPATSDGWAGARSRSNPNTGVHYGNTWRARARATGAQDPAGRRLGADRRRGVRVAGHHQTVPAKENRAPHRSRGEQLPRHRHAIRKRTEGTGTGDRGRHQRRRYRQPAAPGGRRRGRRGLHPSNLEHAIQPPVEAEHLVSLAAVACEPLWFFY
jgi:hypothetical protein